MWQVYRLSKGSFSGDIADDMSIPSFFAEMISKLPRGSYFKIIGLFIGKSVEDVIKLDSLDLAAIFMGGMIKNNLLSFHKFVEDLNVRRN